MKIVKLIHFSFVFLHEILSRVRDNFSLFIFENRELFHAMGSTWLHSLNATWLPKIVLNKPNFCMTSFSVDYHQHVTSLAFVERFLWSDFYLGYWRFFRLYFCHVNIKICFQSLLFFLWFCKNKALNTFFLHFPFLCSFSELSLKYVFIIK